jgi:hypothetical protein
VLICAIGGTGGILLSVLLRSSSRMRGEICPPRKASTSMVL